jgi:hypothetical protein
MRSRIQARAAVRWVPKRHQRVAQRGRLQALKGTAPEGDDRLWPYEGDLSAKMRLAIFERGIRNARAALPFRAALQSIGQPHMLQPLRAWIAPVKEGKQGACIRGRLLVKNSIPRACSGLVLLEHEVENYCRVILAKRTRLAWLPGPDALLLVEPSLIGQESSWIQSDEHQIFGDIASQLSCPTAWGLPATRRSAQPLALTKDGPQPRVLAALRASHEFCRQRQDRMACHGRSPCLEICSVAQARHDFVILQRQQPRRPSNHPWRSESPASLDQRRPPAAHPVGQAAATAYRALSSQGPSPPPASSDPTPPRPSPPSRAGPSRPCSRAWRRTSASPW